MWLVICRWKTFEINLSIFFYNSCQFSLSFYNENRFDTRHSNIIFFFLSLFSFLIKLFVFPRHLRPFIYYNIINIYLYSFSIYTCFLWDGRKKMLKKSFCITKKWLFFFVWKNIYNIYTMCIVCIGRQGTIEYIYTKSRKQTWWICFWVVVWIAVPPPVEITSV